MRTLVICVFFAIGVAAASDRKVDIFQSAKSRRFLFDAKGLTAAEKSQIQNGFTVASHLADKLDKVDFGGVLGALLGSASKFLGVIGPFVGFALSFVHTDSAQYQLLRTLFTQVENRFDQVDQQFAQLRRQVAFVPTQVHFTDLESNINAVQAEMNLLAKVKNAAGYKYESNEFKKTYDRTYESAGIKLYNGIVHGGLTTGGIFDEFVSYSSYDRKNTQKFMLGTLNLLIRAAVLEISYAQISRDPNIATRKSQWDSRFKSVKSKMMAIDSAVVKNYHNQLITDVNDFATKHPKGTLSNTDFSTQLYNTLHTKFFWRDWLVIAAGVHGSDKFVNHACELNQHDNHGRSIVVASVDKTKKHIDMTAASHILTPLTLYRSFIGRGDHKRHYVCVDSNNVYSHLPDSARNQCSTYAAAGVMCTTSADSHIRAASGRYKSYTPHGANRAYLFG